MPSGRPRRQPRSGFGAQFAGGKRPAPTEPAGETRALRPCPYRRAAHEKKLGKQRSVFPGRRRTEKAASRKLGCEPAPAHIRVPRRRLCQRAAHALGGVTGELGGNLRGIEDAIKKPPARVSYGKQSTGLFSYFPALADATKTLGALPPIPPPPLKRWTKLLPAYGAHAS